jgi:hypothetical protein
MHAEDLHSEKLHLEASAFANQRKKEAERAYNYLPSHYNEIWLAHYEGYKAGVDRGC